MLSSYYCKLKKIQLVLRYSLGPCRADPDALTGECFKVLHTCFQYKSGVGTNRYISRRPSMALSMVTSSVYSMSLPTGMPMAMRVMRSPGRFSCWAR